MGVRILSLFATLASSVVLARVLGDVDYGIYAFALSVTALLALPVQAGLPLLVIRETASADSARDGTAMRSIIGWALRINIIFALVVVLAVLAVTLVAGDGISTQDRLIFWLAALLILPVALCSTLGAILRGLRKVMSGLYPIEVVRPLLISLLVAAGVVLAAPNLDATAALALNLVATLAVLALLVVLVMRALPPESRRMSGMQFQTSSWLKALVPLALMSSLHLVNQNADMVMLGIFREPQEVGYYKVAVSGAGFVIFGLSAIQVVAMPYVSRFHVERDPVRMQRLAAACAGGSVLLAVPVFALYLAVGRPLIGLVYGASFEAAWEPLMLLSIAQIINGVFGIVWPLLVMTGNEKAGFRGMIVATAINVTLNAVLIPDMGAVGAAIATGISVIVWNVLFWISARRLIGIDASPLGLLRRARPPHKEAP